MQSGQPSRTARAAAVHRAAHQVLEKGRIFADPLALCILGEDAEALARDAGHNPHRRAMRLFIAVRTRFAEDALAAAVTHGVGQLVVLGAGLDTYAYRGAMRDRLRIFEVDHPATQAWKRQRLADADIPMPRTLTFAPVDFERETLRDGLAAAGFDPAQRSFFTWLGVVPYLTEEAAFATLSFIGSLPGGEIAEDIDGAPHFALGFGQRLAFLAGHVGGHLLEFLVEDVGGFEQDVAARGAAHGAPGGQGGGSGSGGVGDVLRAAFDEVAD